MAPGDLDDPAELVVDLRLRAFDLDDQQRLAIGVVRPDMRLGRLDHQPVHVLDRHRQDAGLDDVGDAGAGHLGAVEADQHRPRALGLGEDAQGRLGDHAELALGAADQAEQVEPAGIEMRAADLDHLAVGHDHGHAQQVVGGHAVFQAMRAARVHRDVAGDGAGELARRVGGVEEPVLLHRAGDGEVGAARLHPDEAVVVVGLEHPVHPGDAEHHASAVGSAPPASEVPAPRGTTGTPSSWQIRITAETSSVEAGSTAQSGGQR